MCFAAIFIFGCGALRIAYLLGFPSEMGSANHFVNPLRTFLSFCPPTLTLLAELHLWEDRCEGLLGEHSW